MVLPPIMITEPDGEIPAQTRLPKRLWGSSYKAVAVGSTPTSRIWFMKTLINKRSIYWDLYIKLRMILIINFI